MVLLTQSTATHKPITEEALQAAGIPARFIDEALRTSRWMEERRITGDVPTDRSSNLHNLQALARRDPYYTFGLSLDSHWDEASLLDLMHRRVGISADPTFTSGQDYIDTLLTITELYRYAQRIGEVAYRTTWPSNGAGESKTSQSGENKRMVEHRPARILCATGHPACLGLMYVPLLRALQVAGCELFSLNTLLGNDSPVTGRQLVIDGPDEGELRQVQGVLLRYHNGNLMHTHQPQYMRAVLRELASSSWRPDLVIADHGWAVAAGLAGFETLAIADCNDTAAFVAAEQGSVEICVPMDDGEPETSTGPVTDFIVKVAGLKL